MDYPLTLSRTMTGRDKIVINMKELKEKKVNSNIIKDQYNNLRSFRRIFLVVYYSFKMSIYLFKLFDFIYFNRQCYTNNQINETIFKDDIEQF